MNLRHLTCFCLSLLLIASCNDTDEIVVYDTSKDAQIYAFSVEGTFNQTTDTTAAGRAIQVKDSIDAARLTAARFAIDQLRGVIYNPDSLPYGLIPKKVKLNFTFNENAGGISQLEIYTPDSVQYYIWNGSDSLDLSKMPVKFMVSAPSGQTKEYELKLRIHQTDPDTIVWQRQPDFEAGDNPQKKVLLHNDVFYAYAADDVSASLYTADKTTLAWTQQSLQGLPAAVLFESITIMGGTFFAVAGNGDSYLSSDGIVWTQQTNGTFINSIYGVIPGTTPQDDVLLLAVKGEDGKLYFGTTKDFSIIDIIDKVSAFPNDPSIQPSFPVRNFSSVTNYDNGLHYNLLMITAGLNNDGHELSATWLIRQVTGGLEVTPSLQNPYFKGTGISTFPYDNALYAFASFENENDVIANALYCSKSWGNIWTKAPGKQQMTNTIPGRTQQSIIVDNENYIWIFGGISESGTALKDVWKGRLNRIAAN